MWHLLMAHHQKSFLPFSSRQSLSCCLSHMPKRSTPKPHGPLLFTPSEPRGPPHSPSELHGPPYLLQNCKVLSIYSRTAWSSLSIAVAPRYKSQHPSSSAAAFLTPPTISYTCQHSHILPALLGCHSKSGQVWPHGMEPIISKLSTQGL